MAGKVGYPSLRPSGRARRIESMRTVLVVLFDDVQSLDVTGPVEVFAGAETQTPGTYRIRTASLDGTPVRSSSGLTVVPDSSLADAPAPHTLLVPGGPGTRGPDPRVTAWLRAHGPRAERLVSVCTGAILLAEAGPPGRSPRHHALGVLRETCPRPSRSRGRPGPDLRPRRPRLHLGRCHLGHRSRPRPGRGGPGPGHGADHRPPPGRVPAPAGEPGPVQRPARRPDGPAGAPARSPAVDHRTPRRRPERRVPRRPRPPLTPPLRPRLPVRDRHAPGRYVDRVRLEHARRLLEDTADGIEQISRSSGYGTPESMRRAFLKTLGTSPAEYRRRFHPT